MDYQLQQTGQEVQEILNQAPNAIAASALDTLDATGMYYTTDDNGKVSGIVLCTAEIEEGATIYVQSYLHDGVVELRAGSSLPLTGQWANLAQMQIDVLNTALGNKVSKRAGYDLSQNDFTDYYKGSIESLMRTVASLSQNKQDKIADLDAIRSGASAGSTAVQPAELTPIQNAIDDIEAVIPSEASAQNQLADKNYVDNHSSDVDDALSTTSENPVQNKVVTNALNGKQATIDDLSTIRSGAAAGATAVQPAAMNSALAEKQDTIDDISTIRSGAAAGATAVQPAAMNSALAEKQDTIDDISTIRSGAAAGATAVQPAELTPIQNAIDDIEAVIPSEASAQNQLADKNYVDNHSSDVDDALSTTSENPVQNKVVTNALNGKQATIDDLSTIRSGAAAGATAVQPAELTPIQNAIDDIEAVIPSEASAQNQLADKNYVDTHSSDVDDALSTTSENPVQNKVVTNALNGKQTTISDLSTIRSGAAAGATAVQPATMNTALAEKQDTLTFDNAPTANSNNPVKSGGVKTAIDAKQDTINTVNVTVDNNTGTPSGSASVSGGTLSLSFQNLKGETGAQGPQGIQGVQGVQGPKGDTGVTGDASSLAIIHGIDKTSSYVTTDVCGADAAQALLNAIEGDFYY